MAIVRTQGVIPAEGYVDLPGRPVRKSFRYQNQAAANTQDVRFASGFTWKALVPGATVNEPYGEGIQGAIRISGTPGDGYDAEEVVA